MPPSTTEPIVRTEVLGKVVALRRKAESLRRSARLLDERASNLLAGRPTSNTNERSM